MTQLKVLAWQLRKKDIAITTIIAASIYFLTSLTILNFKMISSFLTTSLTTTTKLSVLPYVLLRSFTQMDPWMQVVHIAIAILFALNGILVYQKYRSTRKTKNLKLNFGAGLISIGAAGCASCGFSAASLVGLGAASAALPFQGTEILISTLAILTFTLIYNLRAATQYCPTTN